MQANTPNNAAYEQLMNEPERPQTLKILCILSFIACGLMMIVYGLGSLCLALDEATIATFWDKMVEKEPKFEDVDPLQFFHQFGMVCVYSLIATVFSLIGVIMMWKLEKIGFFVYVVAELSTNFLSINMETGEEKNWGGFIFVLAIDLVFIGLYLSQFKFMNKRNNNTFVQSGS